MQRLCCNVIPRLVGNVQNDIFHRGAFNYGNADHVTKELFKIKVIVQRLKGSGRFLYSFNPVYRIVGHFIEVFAFRHQEPAIIVLFQVIGAHHNCSDIFTEWMVIYFYYFLCYNSFEYGLVPFVYTCKVLVVLETDCLLSLTA